MDQWFYLIERTGPTMSAIAFEAAAKEAGLYYLRLDLQAPLPPELKPGIALLRSTGIDYCDRDLSWARQLEGHKTHFFPTPEQVERLRGKERQWAFFQSLQLPIPPTFRLNDIEAQLPKLEETSYVLKPWRSLKGKGQVLVESKRSLLSLVKALATWGDQRFLIQRFIEKKEEWRLFFVGEELFALKKQQLDPLDWQGNRGHHHEELADPSTIPSAIRTIAETAYRASGLPYSALDLVLDHEGQAYLLEINCAPGFQSFTERGIPMAKLILASLQKSIS